jgi:phosphoserine phosphatase
MTKWRLTTPVDAVVFDCDGTLSKIEGIDQLAMQNGVGEKVKQLTAQAMGETGLSEGLYQERLELVRPTREQVEAVVQQYYQNRVAHIEELVRLLKSLGKAVYIVSAGLYPAVAGFGKLLGFPVENINAVEIQFDDLGNYSSFNHTTPLIKTDGKRGIVANIKKRHANLGYVGDGMNDLAVMDLVQRFVGYGGSFYYENVAAHCDFYITTPSMLPMLPLLLTASEANTLTGADLELLNQGDQGILDGNVDIR